MIKIFRNGQRRYKRLGRHGFRHSSFSDSPFGLLPKSFGALVGFDELRLLPGDAGEMYCDEEAEVVTYIHKGALTQEDTDGNSSAIHTGEFQRVSSCCRIRYREMSIPKTAWTRLFRMSLRPSNGEADVGNEKRRITAGNRRNKLCVVASQEKREGALRINQDAFIYSAILETGHHLVHELRPGRCVWFHLICGSVSMDDSTLTSGDSVALSKEPAVSFTVKEDAEILLVDLPFGEVERFKLEAVPKSSRQEIRQNHKITEESGQGSIHSAKSLSIAATEAMRNRRGTKHERN